MSNLSISMFGEFSVQGLPQLTLKSAKSKSLLAYLALRPGEQVLRLTLAKTLWRGTNSGQGRHNISRELKPICDALGTQLTTTKKTICLESNGLYVDALVVDRAQKIGTTDLLSNALKILDKGNFLPELTDEWVLNSRDQYNEVRLDIVKKLIVNYTKEGNHDSARTMLRRQLALLPDQEEPYHDLISYFLDCNNLSQADIEYKNLTQMLQTNAVPPSPATRVLARRLQTMREIPVPPLTEASPPGVPKQRLKNAPVQSTSFVGRSEVMKTVLDHLLGESPARLLTLTGVGGVGKTRLSLEAANTAISSFPDGGWFIDLSPVRDPRFLEEHVLKEMGINDAKNNLPKLQSIIHDLQSKKALLVLNNCEHLVQRCRQLVANLLDGCPNLQVVVTSRQSLGLKSEIQVSVARLPLVTSVLPTGTLTDALVDEIARSEAAELFIARAKSVRSDFTLTKNNILYVLEMCRNLDGLPYAIELLARWAKDYETERLLGMSKRPMNFMGDALRWMLSSDVSRLSPLDRSTLFLIAISYGGLKIQAAEFILGDLDRDVLRSFRALENCSLIQMASPSNGETRVNVLETVRAFVLETMSEWPESTVLHTRQVQYLSDLVSSQLKVIGTLEQPTGMETISAEINNIRAALAWCQMSSQAFDVGLCLVRDMYDYWVMGGLLTEGYQWFVSFGDHVASQTVERKKLRASVINKAGNLAYLQNNLEGARTHYEEASIIQREIGDSKGVAATLGNLASLADINDDYDRALELQQASLKLHESLGLRWEAAVNMLNLGGIEFRQKRYSEAQAIWEKLLPVSDELGRPELRLKVLTNLGGAVFELGNSAGAWKYYCEVLVLSRQMNDVLVTTRCFENMAEVLCERKHWQLAIQLFGAADTWREKSGFFRHSSEESNVTDLKGQAEDAVGASDFRQHYDEGRDFSLESATAMILSWNFMG